MTWLALIRPGDWLFIIIFSSLTIFSAQKFWQGGRADRAIIKQENHLFAEIDLQSKRLLEVPGPLGITQIAVEPGRARIISDPGPKQYCVHQGWLMRPGEIAICATNRVSLQIVGRTKIYDSISY